MCELRTLARGRDRNDPSKANWRSTSFAATQIFNNGGNHDYFLYEKIVIAAKIQWMARLWL